MDIIGIKVLSKRPKGIEHIEKRTTHCNMVAKAREGRRFYATNEDYSCPLSRWNLGLQKRNDAFKTTVAEYLVKRNNSANLTNALKFLDSLPVLKEERRFFFYSPFEEGREYDLLIHIGRPYEVMEFVRKQTKEMGERLSVTLGGIGAVCGEITATSLLNRAVSLSLGCCGARKYGKIKEDELLLGEPR